MWEKGARDKNEDSLVFWHMGKGRENKAIAVICDGIGGFLRGEEASSYVVRQVANWFMSGGYKQNGRKRKQIVQQFLYQVHEEIKEYGKEKGSPLGTTMTMVFIDNFNVHWFHCGDCRLYLFHNGKVKKLTGEHQDGKGNLNRAIGVGEWKLLENGSVRIGKNDRLLLCSDGLYRNLEQEEWNTWFGKRVSSDEQANRMLKQLLGRKIAKGEKDNLSALYFGYTKKEEI